MQKNRYKFLLESLFQHRSATRPCTATRRRSQMRSPCRRATSSATWSSSMRAGYLAATSARASGECCPPTTWGLCEKRFYSLMFTWNETFSILAVAFGGACHKGHPPNLCTLVLWWGGWGGEVVIKTDLFWHFKNLHSDHKIPRKMETYYKINNFIQNISKTLHVCR